MAKLIAEGRFEPASLRILEDPRLALWADKSVEIWLYEDRAARDALEARLRDRGIHARVRSAYKPLLHHVLEVIGVHAVREAVIEYPRHPQASATRFLSEAYPLAELIPAPLRWVAADFTADLPAYRVTWRDAMGVGHVDTVLAPNRTRRDHLGRECLAPGGHLRVIEPADGRVLIDEPVETEIEALFHAAMQAICAYSWGRAQPYFERMEIRADLPGAEICHSNGRLLASTLEALHEDLYFSALEFFQHFSGRPPGDRGLQPGQIVPDVRSSQAGSSATLQVIVHPAGTTPLPALASAVEPQGPCVPAALATMRTPVSARQVGERIAAIDGVPFAFESRQGRTLAGVTHAGTLPPVVVTGGQHANEASGVVGALRGAAWLEAQPGAHFSCIALENPDGYALFAQYRSVHPQHMHHAARYTGLGDDLEYREHEPWYERAGRMHALAVTGAQLHLSLHGYPAHEWTRPFTGYLPRGFELWSVPKGYFLILRYRPGWKEIAKEFLARLTDALSCLPGLVQFNAVQLRCYEAHAGQIPFDVQHGIACMVSENDRQTPGVVLVTEFPDETIEGDDFVFAHEVQFQTVRLATEIWWDLNRG